MKKFLSLLMFSLAVPACLFSAVCPTELCPDDRDTPVAVYNFENNMLDSSGHNLTGGDMNPNPARHVTFNNGIGGVPGYSLGNFTPNMAIGVTVPACSIYRDEGEIEWDEYVIQSVNENQTIYWWDGTRNMGVAIYSGDATQTSDNAIRVLYYYEDASKVVHTGSYFAEVIVFNTWQHIQWQWGPWGTRLLVDGIFITGSLLPFSQFSRTPPYMYVGSNGTFGFNGYIDNLVIWPCSNHGILSPTPTYTITKTETITPTWTISQTHTDTVTPTITPTVTTTDTYDPTSTSTVTETDTVTPTLTESPVPSFTETVTLTYTNTYTATITATITPTATQAYVKLFGPYPNPAKDRTRIVFSSSGPCLAELSVFTISGETAGEATLNASAGMNAILFRTKNRDGVALASGVYLYRLRLKFSGGQEKDLWGKFSAAK